MHAIAHRRTIAKVAALAATAALAAGMTGCASSSGTDSGTEDKGPVTLEYWSGIPAAEQAAKVYEKSHPNVKINVENPADSSAKLATALKAGSGAPDVAMTGYTNIPQLVGGGGLADLSKYGVSSKKSDYLDWTWKLVSSGDAVYAVPLDIGPTALVYNKNVLDQYGIAVPTTWDEFATAAAELHDKSGGTVAIANIPGTWADWFVGLAWQNGSRPWSVDSDGKYTQSLNDEAAKQVAEYWQPLLDKGYLTTYPQFSQDLWNALSAGQIATAIEAAWGAGGWAQNVSADTKGVWRSADLPQWSGSGDFASGDMGGSAILVPEQGKHKQAATDFALWLSGTKEGTQTEYDISGTFAAAKVGLKLDSFTDPTKNPSNFFGGQNVAAVYAKAADAVDQSFVYAPWYPAVSDAYSASFADAVAGKTTLVQALDSWQDATLAQAKQQGYEVTAP
jgi:multiple sugar transport system substrate-binding protein